MLRELHLVVGLSARSVAQMAWRAGVPVATIDGFGDEDTRAYAELSETVGLSADFALDTEQVVDRVQRLAQTRRIAGAVLVSGFEAQPGTIDRIQQIVPIVGNTADVVRRVKDPFALSALLTRLNIPHPRVFAADPLCEGEWVIKRAGACGGGHVRRASRDSAVAPGEYFQQFVPGDTLSVLFLANATRARLVGANRYWTCVGTESPYAFSGAVSVALDTLPCRHEIQRALDDLVRATGLRGLNGIDLVMRGMRWWLLEVNPRPTATAELHDGSWPGGLFAAHLKAAAGELPGFDAPRFDEHRGLQTVFAHATHTLPRGMVWPEWVTDRPCAGSTVVAGQPLCTAHAVGQSERDVRELLADRAATVLARTQARAA